MKSACDTGVNDGNDGKIKQWSNTISFTNKFKLYKSLVNSILPYHCETRTLLSYYEKRIQVSETKCLRKLLSASPTWDTRPMNWCSARSASFTMYYMTDVAFISYSIKLFRIFLFKFVILSVQPPNLFLSSPKLQGLTGTPDIFIVYSLWLNM